MPERYPLYRNEPWHNKYVRFTQVKKYLLFYIVNKENNTILILRILYSGMDISHQLEDIDDFK